MRLAGLARDRVGLEIVSEVLGAHTHTPTHTQNI